MSRYRMTAVTSLCLLSLIMLGTGAGPMSKESAPKDAGNSDLEQQLAESRDEISRLQSQLNAYKETRTGTDLMRVLIAEPQIWEGTVTQRSDYRDRFRLDCKFETSDFKSQLRVRLVDNPGDLTVGDVIRVRGRLGDVSRTHSRTSYILEIEDATLLEKSRPAPINSKSD